MLVVTDQHTCQRKAGKIRLPKRRVARWNRARASLTLLWYSQVVL